MSKKMYANFSDEAYNDLMSGGAVDNNGLRSPKGSFYPDQPSFEPINERKEQLQDAGVQLLIAAGGVFVLDIVLPEVKRFAQEKMYPFAVEKWDSWQEKHREKNAEKKCIKANHENTSEESAANYAKPLNNSRIVNLDDYRKMA